ncbi:UDP-N-acetylmuramate dehydrogenase [bacterium]|nr:UDP-N-acetylmuramate dehydrogenase [bacterium]
MEIIKELELKNHTTFKIGGKCRIVAFPDTKEELLSLLKEYPDAIVLGSCSDVLISSLGVIEPIIITTNIKNFEFDKNIIKVECGAKGPFISKECQLQGLSGFEFMIGFPGSFGGMLNMNASAHNQAVSDYFKSAKVFSRKKKKVLELKKSDMDFEYRCSSIAKTGDILLEAEFELPDKDRNEIQELMDRNIEFRRLRQPSLATPNAGSVFKNPENDSAGRLLDMAGAKGMCSGGANVWERHANFIVNSGDATSLDVLTLIYKMIATVNDKYRIRLNPEIKYIGIKETEEYRLWELIKTQK